MTKSTLILLPGLLCDASVWEYQQAHLHNIADIRIADFSSASTPNEMVAAVLEIAPQTFALAGHSMGGWVALELMRGYSKRVERLCLLNTSAQLDSPQKRQFRLEMIKYTESHDFDVVINKLLNAFVYHPEYSRQIKAMFERNLPSFIRQEKAMLMREDTMPVLKHIECPTLVIQAENDKVFDFKESELIANNITHSSLAVIKDCGHMSIVESADAVTDLMRKWLLT